MRMPSPYHLRTLEELGLKMCCRCKYIFMRNGSNFYDVGVNIVLKKYDKMCIVCRDRSGVELYDSPRLDKLCWRSYERSRKKV